MLALSLIVWVCVGLFVVTSVITVLALLGRLTLGGGTGKKHDYYLRKLFTVLILEIATAAVGTFALYLQDARSKEVVIAPEASSSVVTPATLTSSATTPVEVPLKTRPRKKVAPVISTTTETSGTNFVAPISPPPGALSTAQATREPAPPTVKSAVLAIVTSNTKKDKETRVIVSIESRAGKRLWTGEITDEELKSNKDNKPYLMKLDPVTAEVNDQGPYKLTISIETKRDDWEFAPTLELKWSNGTATTHQFSIIEFTKQNFAAVREELPRAAAKASP